MTPEEFLRDLVALTRRADLPPADDQRRAFLTASMARAGELDAPPRSADDYAPFRRLIMGNWNHLRWRILGHTTELLHGLGDLQRRALRLLEDSPDLLGPLDATRTEIVHTRLLEWFLSRPDRVGRRCRVALLRHLDLDTQDAAEAQFRTDHEDS